MNSIVRLDTRGRLVIPNEFRDILDLKEGDTVLLSLNSESNTITVSPIYGKQSELVKIEIIFGDKPGSLARTADLLSELKIDLIMTESKSFQRGTKARWDIIADISKSELPLSKIKRRLTHTSFVEHASINTIARGRLHR